MGTRKVDNKVEKKTTNACCFFGILPRNVCKNTRYKKDY